MADGSRLVLAVARGVVTLRQGGPVAVFRAPAGYDLSPLDASRVQVVQRFRPDHDDADARGLAVTVAPEGRYAAALVVVPRAKRAARALIAEARGVTDGPILVDGQKTDGVDGLLREIRARAEVGEVLAKAHGKIFELRGGEFGDWRAAPREVAGFFIPVGGFSADGPDPASVALAAALPPRLGGRMADLGAGWGYLARTVLAAHDGVEVLHLVEADHAALECARANVPDARARFHWADARRFRPPEPLDTVVTNPPFHHGRRPDPSLGRAFIAAAGGMLKPAGALWLVANRHLPYEEALRDAFRTVEEAGGDGVFKIIRAARPRQADALGRQAMSFSISGKTAVVTGAANGVGLAIARHFAGRGANVVFADRDEEKLDREIGELAAEEGNVRAFAGDLREKLAVANLISTTIDAFDRVDILVNASRQMVSSDPLNSEDDAVELLLQQNLLTGLRLTQVFAKRMIAQFDRSGNEGPAGSIINLSSIAARRTHPDLLAYSVSSAAMDQMTRSMAVALAPYRIRVNAVAFGSVMSASLQDMLKRNEEVREDIIDHTPLHRIASAAELAEVAQFLASDGSGFMTGQILTVDGGRTLVDPVEASAH